MKFFPDSLDPASMAYVPPHPSGGGGWGGPATGLVHRWALDSLTITDLVGSINGTAGAGCSLTTGPSGAANTAVAFNGTQAPISLASAPGVSSSSSFTYALWIKPTTFLTNDGGDSRYIAWGAGPGGTATDVVISGVNGASSPQGFNFDTSNASASKSVASGIATGSWQHFAIVWNTSALVIYKNAVSQSLAGAAGDGGDAGVYEAGGRNSTDRLWAGAMAQIVVYNVALSSGDVSTLYGAF